MFTDPVDSASYAVNMDSEAFRAKTEPYRTIAEKLILLYEAPLGGRFQSWGHRTTENAIAEHHILLILTTHSGAVGPG